MEFQTWFFSIPPITRYYLCGVFATTFAITYGILTPKYLYFDTETTFFNFQLWRILTNFLFAGKFSFNFVMFLMMAYTRLMKLETEAKEKNNYSELVMLFVYVISMILLITVFLQQGVFLSMEFLFALIYIDCKRNPEVMTQIYMWTVKNAYVPWALCGLSIVMGGSIMSNLVGIAAGHVYYFVKDIAPLLYSYDILKTPQFLKNLVDKPVRRTGGSTYSSSVGSINNSNSSGNFGAGATQNSGDTQARQAREANQNDNSFTAFSGRGSTWG